MPPEQPNQCAGVAAKLQRGAPEQLAVTVPATGDTYFNNNNTALQGSDNLGCH